MTDTTIKAATDEQVDDALRWSADYYAPSRERVRALVARIRAQAAEIEWLTKLADERGNEISNLYAQAASYETVFRNQETKIERMQPLVNLAITKANFPAAMMDRTLAECVERYERAEAEAKGAQ